MDLNLSPEELQFRDELREWLRSNMPRDWSEWREKPIEESFPYLRAWQRKLHEGRWAAVSWPKEYGGRSATLAQQAIFWEEMARVEAPPMANALGLGLIGPTIIGYGTDEQKKRFIPKILSAEEIWCQGFSEPNAGSDLASLQTEARLDGGHYIVNGQKVWTSYGWVGNWCELVVRTDPDAPKHKGLTVLLIDMKSPGVEVRPLRQMTGESEFNEMFFRDVRVPVKNILGKVHDGWNVAVSTLMHERGAYGARLHPLFKRNINRLIELSRKFQKNGHSAAQDPLARQKLAQCYAEIEIMRMNQLRAFSRISGTGAPGPEGSIQKIFWSELNQRLQQVAQEIFGPYGQLLGGDSQAVDKGIWSYGYLRTRGNTIEAGTSEVQRSIIGHFVLGLPKSY
ncbi:MAG TPA: acyl-CoA dehydrogenase family protein [Candidatus Udaeobacter sp.]|jgi:alkylation response protein AidB-like acyl-CoA dehydrogenase|nr:acyl-CoA dehydrogenase family protein [Candidatus Udaeobacter sp.]